MDLRILREIASNIRSVFYTIMADETADVSNKEQLVICIRWVDENLIAHEDFIGMHPIERTTADVIVRVLKVPIKCQKFQTHHQFSLCNLQRKIIFNVLYFALTLGCPTSN